MPRPVAAQTALVTGATGQDGYYLVSRLLADGWTVHAAVRDLDGAERMFGRTNASGPCAATCATPARCARSSATSGPRSSTTSPARAASRRRSPTRARPGSRTRTSSSTCSTRSGKDSPETRFYQASSGEMFGSVAGESVVHDEGSALNPQSPYAAAKAAAHMLCRSYRESYGIRIACGILFNHESRRRGPQFLSRKVVDHVGALRSGIDAGPARARQPEGGARLGLRARLRRGDGRDPAPGRACAASPTRRPPTATTSSAPGSCTPSGSSPTAPSRSPASSSTGISRATTRSLVGGLRRLRRAGGRRRPGVHPALRPARDRRRPGPGRGRARLDAAAGPRPLPRRHARRAGLQ